MGKSGFAITDQDVRLLLKMEDALVTHCVGRQSGYVHLIFDDNSEETVKTGGRSDMPGLMPNILMAVWSKARLGVHLRRGKVCYEYTTEEGYSVLTQIEVQ